jgi:hypothetical protein
MVVDSEPPESVLVFVPPLEVDVVVVDSIGGGYSAVKMFPARVRTLISTSPTPL